MSFWDVNGDDDDEADVKLIWHVDEFFYNPVQYYFFHHHSSPLLVSYRCCICCCELELKEIISVDCRACEYSFSVGSFIDVS